MRKILPTLLFPIIVSLIIPIDIFASSLDVSKSSNFSGNDLNFAGGETVYVRVMTDKSGSSSVLSIRDNNYSSIKTVNLNRNGDTYSASFSAPSAEGYYSLEAKIEGVGLKVTSVKTIKVGSPTSANINVNVNSSVKGTKTVTKSETVETTKDLKNTEVPKVEDELGKSNVEVFSAEAGKDIDKDQDRGQGFFGMIFGVFEGAWNLVKFF